MSGKIISTRHACPPSSMAERRFCKPLIAVRFCWEAPIALIKKRVYARLAEKSIAGGCRPPALRATGVQISHLAQKAEAPRRSGSVVERVLGKN